MPWWSWLTWWRPPCILRSVIVILKDDPTMSLRGVLWSVRGPWYTLKNASLLRKSADSPHAAIVEEPSDGDLIIHRSNVSYLQLQVP